MTEILRIPESYKINLIILKRQEEKCNIDISSI